MVVCFGLEEECCLIAQLKTSGPVAIMQRRAHNKFTTMDQLKNFTDGSVRPVTVDVLPKARGSEVSLKERDSGKSGLVFGEDTSSPSEHYRSMATVSYPPPPMSAGPIRTSSGSRHSALPLLLLVL